MNETKQNQPQTKNNSRLVFNDDGSAQFVMDSGILEMVRAGRNTALSLQNIFAQLEDVLVGSSEELAIQRSVSVELAGRIKTLEDEIAIRDNMIKELQISLENKQYQLDNEQVLVDAPNHFNHDMFESPEVDADKIKDKDAVVDEIK